MSRAETPLRAACVVFDADSTLAGIEGIDWLAALRQPEVAQGIAAMTEAAMTGELDLEDVYGARLSAVAPTRREVAALGAAYVAAAAAGADACVRALRDAGVRVLIVSGGIREALLPLAQHLGVSGAELHAVALDYDATGRCVDFDRESPLARAGGKATLVASLALPRPIIAVGDGNTDLEIRLAGACDHFIAFTGFVRRDGIVDRADESCDSFATLTHRILHDR